MTVAVPFMGLLVIAYLNFPTLFYHEFSNYRIFLVTFFPFMMNMPFEGGFGKVRPCKS